MIVLTTLTTDQRGQRVNSAMLRLRGRHAPITAEVFWPEPEPEDQPLIVALGGDGAALCERDWRIVLWLRADLLRGGLPWNGGVDDAWAALRWAADHAAELGARPGCVALTGDRARAGHVRELAELARADGWPKLLILDAGRESS